MPERTFDSLHTIEPAYHPKSKMSFLVDWLVTLKCNYDCAYCPISEFGHDNSIPHPTYDRCVHVLKQLYAYTDVMMTNKREAFKDAVMNVYGGESLYHPRFIDLAEATSREFEKYSGKWRIRRRITTNGAATTQNWKKVMEHMEGVTMSYHSTGPDKFKSMFKANLEYTMRIGKTYDVVVLMYPNKDNWQDCVKFMRYCVTNGVNARPKLIDGPMGIYTEEQINDLSEFMKEQDLKGLMGKRIDEQIRACCGGRQLCTNRNIKEYQTTVPRGPDGYKGWACSANQFFIYGNTVTGEYFTNKDCQTTLTGGPGPIANIDTMGRYTQQLKEQIALGQMPVLTCVMNRCLCGTCAPKSRSFETLEEIMKIYNTTTH